MDTQLEMLAGEECGGQRGQACQGQDDLGGDGGGMEQVPGTPVVDRADQPAGAGPAQVEPGTLTPTRRRADGGGGGLAARKPCSRRSSSSVAASGLAACPRRRELVTQGRFGGGQFGGLAGAVVDQDPVGPSPTAGLLMGLHPDPSRPGALVAGAGPPVVCTVADIVISPVSRRRGRASRPAPPPCSCRYRIAYGWKMPNVRREGGDAERAARGVVAPKSAAGRVVLAEGPPGRVAPPEGAAGTVLYLPKVRRDGLPRPKVRRDGW